ncbi:MAG: hypothetical protein QM504_10180 [Pseudomonadota bacterium]
MKNYTKLMPLGAGCITANIILVASSFINPCNRWSASLKNFAPLAGGIDGFKLSKDEARAKIAEYKNIYTMEFMNKEFIKYIVKLNTWAERLNSPYSLRANRDDGLDCEQALATDIIDHISLYASDISGLDSCIADFYDSEQAVLFFKKMVGS